MVEARTQDMGAGGFSARRCSFRGAAVHAPEAGFRAPSSAKKRPVTTHSLLTIPVREGAADALVEAFHRLDVFGHAAQVPGFQGGELLRPQEGSTFVVHARWASPAGYQAWLDAPVRATLSGELDDLVAGPMTSALYDGVG